MVQWLAEDAIYHLVTETSGQRTVEMYYRREEAPPPTEEAATIRRRLAQTNPDAYLPDLAMSLEQPWQPACRGWSPRPGS